MSHKILFLYLKKEHRFALERCEDVFRAVMRKFRQSTLFSYMEIDTSPTCYEEMKLLFLREIDRYDAVMLAGDRESCAEIKAFIRTSAGFFAQEHHTAGRVICCPVSSLTFSKSDNSIIQTSSLLREDIQKAAKLSSGLAKRRKHSLTICTPSDEAGIEFLGEAERCIKLSDHIQAEYIAFDEMIRICQNTIAYFDVVLTDWQISEIIISHLNALQRVPSGYKIWHTEKARIYCKEHLACEEANNSFYASVFMAFSAILENEFNMKSAADWLRRSISLTFGQYASASCEDFTKAVISEINKPMRNIRGKSNDSAN